MALLDVEEKFIMFLSIFAFGENYSKLLAAYILCFGKGPAGQSVGPYAV